MQRGRSREGPDEGRVGLALSGETRPQIGSGDWAGLASGVGFSALEAGSCAGRVRGQAELGA